MHNLSLGIWREVIANFEYPQDKRTLRALALTSRHLSVLALNTIWRDGRRLPRIVSVINSFAPNQPFLEYFRGECDDEEDIDSEEDDEEKDEDKEVDSEGGEEVTPFSREPGRWVELRPLPDTVRRCASEYLARIRKLSISRYQQAGELTPLWSVLSRSLECHGLLLPNLQSLEIIIPGHLDDDIYDRFNNQVMSTVLNLVQAKGCDLKAFTYEGASIQYLLVIVASFRNLQDINLVVYRLPKKRSTLTFMEFLTALPSLRSLTCDLDSFAYYKGRKMTFQHAALRRINFQSATRALKQLFSSCIFPSVTKARIANGNKVPTFVGLESSFPKVQELELSIGLLVASGDGNLPINFQHLSSLLSLPIRTFILEVVGCTHNLTVHDLHTILDSWPNLRSFKVCSDTDFRDLSSLATFSHHPSLELLDLHLPVHYLLDDILKVPDLIGAHSVIQGHKPPLHTLFFTPSYPRRQDSIATSTAEKRMFVEYLLLLFPSLKELECIRCPHHPFPEDSELPELREILRGLRKEGKDSSDSLV